MFPSGGRLTLAFIFLSVGLNASAQIFLRLAARSGFVLGDRSLFLFAMDALLRPAMLAGLASYALSLVAWIYVLSRAEASYAYPFLGLGFVFVALAGWGLLGETLSAQRLLAMALIIAGIVVLAKS